MGYTLAEARERLRVDYLDDPDDKAWTDASLDRHLRVAFSRVCSWWIGRGAHNFRRTATFQVSGGVLALAARAIVHVQHDYGGRLVAIDGVGDGVERTVYTGAATVSVVYDSAPVFATGDADPFLVGGNDELEELVILEAVRLAAVRDREMPLETRELAKELRKELIEHRGVTRVYVPVASTGKSPLVWSYDYENSQLVFSNAN